MGRHSMMSLKRQVIVPGSPLTLSPRWGLRLMRDHCFPNVPRNAANSALARG